MRRGISDRVPGARGLAIAVLEQALDDLPGRKGGEALAWICEAPDGFLFWCDVAEIEPGMIYRECAERVEKSGLAWVMDGRDGRRCGGVGRTGETGAEMTRPCDSRVAAGRR
jgi:hypothetical protein